MSSPTKIQLFGERCSGTNYLESLIKNNMLSMEISWDYGWKHYFHKGQIEGAPDYLFLVIHRNPFDWASSLHQKPHHAAPELKNIPFSDFIRREWHCVHDKRSHTAKDDPLFNTERMCERDPATGLRFANILRLRTAKIRDWESLRDKAEHTHYIRYEDLLNNPETEMERLADKFRLARTQSFIGVESYKGRGKKKFRPKTYAPINAPDIDHIAAQLDADLELSIGYDIPTLAAERKEIHPDKWRGDIASIVPGSIMQRIRRIGRR